MKKKNVIQKEVKIYDQPGTLMKKVLELFIKDGRTPLQLQIDHGVPFYWVKALQAGTIKNPSVNRIEYLYNLLSKKPLSL